MFQIFANGILVYQPNDRNRALLDPRMTLEMGKAGSLQFRVPPSHPNYDIFAPFVTTVSVKMDGDELFRGRVLTNKRDFYNIRDIYCEGDLAYLVDSSQKNEKFEGRAHDLFRQIIGIHNSRVEEYKQFVIGDITVDNAEMIVAGQSEETTKPGTDDPDLKQIRINSESNNWQTTFDYIENVLIGYLGGYLRTRHEDGVTYIDYLKNYGVTAEQEIAFGKNLLDITDETNVDELFTVLIPLGDENLTIESVSAIEEGNITHDAGSDELVNEELKNQYGRILKTHVFSGVTKPETLLENGLKFMENNMDFSPTITVKAVDMHWVDSGERPILVGHRVRVDSVPHGLVDYMTCTKIDYDLSKIEETDYTFGTPKPSFTEQYRKDQQPKGGGGGGDEEEKITGGGMAKIKEDIYAAFIDKDEKTGKVTLYGLHDQLQNTVKVLHEYAGINVDAPGQIINIEVLKDKTDVNGRLIRQQSSRIDVMNTELKSQISLVAAYMDDRDGVHVANEAELRVVADELGSRVQVLGGDLSILNGDLNVMKGDIELLEGNLELAKGDINVAQGDINVLKGDVTLVEGRISALTGKFNNLITGGEHAEMIYSEILSAGSLRIAGETVGRQAISLWTGASGFTVYGPGTDMAHSLDHSHSFSFEVDEETGKVTALIGFAQPEDGGDFFNIADTQFYKNGVSAAQGAVEIRKSQWSNGTVTFEKVIGGTVYGAAKGVTIQGIPAWDTTDPNLAKIDLYDIFSGSSISTGKTINVDASARYSAGSTAGAQSVTLYDPTWNPITYNNYNEFQVSATNGQYKRQTLYITPSGSWSSGSQMVYLRTGSTSGTIQAQTTVTMPSSGSWSWTVTAGMVTARVTIGGRVYTGEHWV